jgi:endo-1,4-beta-xylanase
MKRREFLKTAAAAGAGLSIIPSGFWGHGLAAFGQQPPATPATQRLGLTLRQAVGERMLIGTAISSRSLNIPAHTALIAEQFNCITAENEMKPISLQRTRGTFTFQTADRMADFAKDHNLQVIGHTLCWHSQAPRFLFQDDNGQPLSREAALANLKAHIDTVVKHFKGKVKGWDVVNEAVNDGNEPYLRNAPARRAIGDDFVVKAFEFAHEADPDAELYYNDYNIDTGSKRERALRLIRQIKQAGVRIDGVGIQGHWMLQTPSVAEIELGIQAFINERVKVMITEMDIDVLPRNRGAGADLGATERQGSNPYTAGLPDDVQRALADRYGALFTMFRRYPEITRVTFWGLSDGTTWLNNFPVGGRTNHPLLFDRQMRPKPAYTAVINALQTVPERTAAPQSVPNGGVRAQNIDDASGRDAQMIPLAQRFGRLRQFLRIRR